MEYEHQLCDIVTRVNEELQRFQEQRKGLGNVILLIGKTGSGKSTLFNFLIGANFELKQVGKKFELDMINLKEDSNKFSLMKSGCTSVTKFPKCFYEEGHKHLIVDFPGFSDTNGWIDEVVIQSLYNKITKNTNLKIAYVNYCPQDDIPNRGADLQEYLKSVISQDSVNLDKITLLMNKYQGKAEEEQLITKLQRKLSAKFSQQAGKIIIQRAVKNEEDVKNNLSDQQREKVWKELIETPVVKLSPYPFKNRDIITKYLTESFNQLFFQTFHEFDSKLSQMKLTIEQAKTLIEKLTQLLTNKGAITDWIDQQDTILKELNNYLNFKTQFNTTKTQIKNFELIYQFFFDFQEQLDGYKQIQHTLNKVKRTCETSIRNLKNTLDQLLKIQELERQKQLEEKQKLELERQKQDLEKKKQEIERLQQEAEKQRKAAEAREKIEIEQAEQYKIEAEKIIHQQQLQFENEKQRLEFQSKAKASERSELLKQQQQELRELINQRARQEKESQQRQFQMEMEALQKENEELKHIVWMTEQKTKQEINQYERLQEETKKVKEQTTILKQQNEEKKTFNTYPIIGSTPGDITSGLCGVGLASIAACPVVAGVVTGGIAGLASYGACPVPVGVLGLGLGLDLNKLKS